MRQALIVENPKWERFSDVSEKFKALSGDCILVVRGRVKEKNPSSPKASWVYKKLAETPKEYAIDLRKQGKTPAEVEQLVKDWKPPTAKDIAAAARPVEINTTSDKPKMFKKQPDSIEALRADLRKQGAKPEEIEKAVAASKLPSIADKVKKAAALLLFCLFGFTASAQQNLLGYLPSEVIGGTTTNSTAGNGVIGWSCDAVSVFQLTCTATNYSASAFTIDLATSDNGTDWVTNAYAIAITMPGYTATNGHTVITRLTNTVGGKWLQVNQMRNLNTNGITINRFTRSGP